VINALIAELGKKESDNEAIPKIARVADMDLI
jgi:hypothetical protein